MPPIESPEAATRLEAADLPASVAATQLSPLLLRPARLDDRFVDADDGGTAWVIFQMTDENRWPAHISTAQNSAHIPTRRLGRLARGPLAQAQADFRDAGSCPGSSTMLLFALVGARRARALDAGSASHWLLGGLIQAVDFPARLAFVLDLTSAREDLMNAVAAQLGGLQRRSGRSARRWSGLTLFLVGPEIACFLLNAASYLAVLWALYEMRIDPKSSKPIHSSGWRSLVGGLSYLASHRELAWLLVLVATTCMCGWPFLALLPAMAKHRFDLAEKAYSLLLSATGLGALLGAVIVAIYGTMERKQLFMRGGVFLVTVSLLGLAVADNVPAVPIFWAGLCGCGFDFSSFSPPVKASCSSAQASTTAGRLWASTRSSSAAPCLWATRSSAM